MVPLKQQKSHARLGLDMQSISNYLWLLICSPDHCRPRSAYLRGSKTGANRSSVTTKRVGSIWYSAIKVRRKNLGKESPLRIAEISYKSVFKIPGCNNGNIWEQPFQVCVKMNYHTLSFNRNICNRIPVNAANVIERNRGKRVMALMLLIALSTLQFTMLQRI